MKRRDEAGLTRRSGIGKAFYTGDNRLWNAIPGGLVVEKKLHYPEGCAPRVCGGRCAGDGSGHGHFLWPAEGAGPPAAWCIRHSRATVLSTPAVGRASLFCGRFQCGSSTMSKKIKMHFRPFERAVSLSVSEEGDSQPRSPRGRGRGGGRLSPPLSPPLRAWLSPQGPVMAAAWMDPAQVSGRCFGHCSFSAGSERSPGQGGAKSAIGFPFVLVVYLQVVLACHFISSLRT